MATITVVMLISLVGTLSRAKEDAIFLGGQNFYGSPTDLDLAGYFPGQDAIYI